VVSIRTFGLSKFWIDYCGVSPTDFVPVFMKHTELLLREQNRLGPTRLQVPIEQALKFLSRRHHCGAEMQSTASNSKCSITMCTFVHALFAASSIALPPPDFESFLAIS
jgi:hypothetical protein